MNTSGDFFIPDNEVRLHEELGYSFAGEYIRSVEKFFRSTYHFLDAKLSYIQSLYK